MTQIISFAGRKQSGKSTSASYIKSLANNSNIYSFADPLKKDVCINILGLTERQCYGTDADKNTLTNLRWENMPCFGTDSWNCLGGYYYE